MNAWKKPEMLRSNKQADKQRKLPALKQTELEENVY
jgi:hypothetical protein